MRLPSWSEFTEKLSTFEKNVREKINEFKDNHSLLDSTIKGLIPILPPPFNAMADKIYNNFDGSEEQKSKVVLSYLKYLETLGEKHYNQIAEKVDALLIEISDIKQITANESTLQKIQEILISSGKETNEKLDLLKSDIEQIGGKIDQIYEIGQDSNKRIRKVETKLAPRHLTSQLISQLENILPKNKNEIILVSSTAGDADAYQFSDQIVNYLISQGRKVEADEAIRSPPIRGIEVEKLSNGIHIWIGSNK